MTTEEAIVRARIAALKNVIAAREGGASVMRAAPKYTRPSAYPRPAYAPYQPRRPLPKSRNLTWKAPDASPPAPAVHAAAPLPYCIPLAATACPTIITCCRSPSQNYNTSNSVAPAAVRPRSGFFVSPSPSAPVATLPTTRTEYCRYYNRFGVCNKQNACPFIHDSRKVAVCRKFLRGDCDDAACTLSHVRDQNKMPVCTRFLKGVCSREDCPFRHVNVSHDAAICDAFLRGYCPDGADCRMKHELPKSSCKSSGGEALVGHVAPASPVDAAPPTEPALSIRPTIRFQPRVAP